MKKKVKKKNPVKKCLRAKVIFCVKVYLSAYLNPAPATVPYTNKHCPYYTVDFCL